jgi:signal-transduction protein with cAMP-binding, CBS, and nucleotidyltransferase domain
VDNGRQALDRLRLDLAECDYLPHATPEWGELLCAGTATWQERFEQWIRDPILSGMYGARPLFDLRPAVGDAGSWRSLEKFIQETIRSEPGFLKILANDCLFALPPLTFFQNEVVDESGERTGIFALEQTAIGPIVEVGRVFGIAHERCLGSSTLERLDVARSPNTSGRKHLPGGVGNVASPPLSASS